MKFYDAKPSFASGELTPLLAAREDLAAYMIGAKELTNFIVVPQGGIVNRPGTKSLSLPGEIGEGARLVPFVFNEDDAYCMVFRPDGSALIYDGDSLAWTANGHPYTAARLENLTWLQSADVMYLFHPDVPPYKLLRRGNRAEKDFTWSFERMAFKEGPYDDINTGDIRVRFLYDGEFGKYVIEADGDIFDPGTNYMAYGGTFFRIEAKVRADSNDITLEYTSGDPMPAPTRSAAFLLFGPSVIQTTGNWTGKVEIFRCDPETGTVESIKTITSDSDNNAAVNQAYSLSVEEYGTYFYIEYSRESGSGSVDITWSSGGGIINRSFRIIRALTSRKAEVDLSIESITISLRPIDWTKDWAFGAFGIGQGAALNGFPSLGIFHQERLVLANTPANPQGIWMSKSASWEDFGISIPAEDTDSISVTLASKEVNEIRGLSSRADLLIFTSGAEWVAKAGSKSDVFTPSSIVITPASFRGSARIAPLDVGAFTLFIQRHAKVVRGMGYQLDIDGYAASDVSILSSHLTEKTRIVRWAYQQEPWSVVWIVLENGHVLALTLQQEHQVTAWTRQVFAENAVDVCSVPGHDDDLLYFLFRGGTGQTRLCRLAQRKDTEYTAADFLDNGVTPYKSVFESLELAQNVGGSLQGRHKHVPRVTIRMFRTGGFRAGILTENSTALDQITFPGELAPQYRTEPYTGDACVSVPGGAAKSCRLRIEADQPLPVTILGVFQEVEVHEG
jgi:hypothetical protein